MKDEPQATLSPPLIHVVDDDGGLLKNAMIRSAVDFSRLEEVFVITGERTPVRP